MGNPLPVGVDLRRVFSSPVLEGLWGIKPVLADVDWMCGAAAVTAALNHMAIHVNQSQVADGTETTKQHGASYKGILRYVCGKRIRCTATKDTPTAAIQTLVRQRKYVLLAWGDWAGHWVLAVGWEGPQEVIVLLDPSKTDQPFVGMRWKDFCQHWDTMPCDVPRVMLELRKSTYVSKSTRGLENRTDFHLRTWATVYGSRNRRKKPSA
jgi:ABC-type bacteriocin/lantibiotic exporter with double-glycine peptidase domain